MKYLLSFLLIVFLFGCGYTTGDAAKNIGNKVRNCCSSLCFSHDPANSVNTGCKDETEPVSVFSTSVLERNGQILTW